MGFPGRVERRGGAVGGSAPLPSRLVISGSPVLSHPQVPFGVGIHHTDVQGFLLPFQNLNRIQSGSPPGGKETRQECGAKE